MILCLCLLLPALSPSGQEICSAPGTLPAPILYMSRTSARPGVSVRLQCSVFSWAPATRVAFCKDGEEVSSQKGSVGKLTNNYDHVVSRGSAGNYSCVYEIKDSHNRVTRSQLSPAKHLSVTGALPVPILNLYQTSTRPGDSVLLQCSVLAQIPATRVIFYKDGKEVSSQMGSEEKIIYGYNHTVSSDSTGNYTCGYETQDSDNRVIRSQFSPAKYLSVTGKGPDLKLLLGITVPAILVLAVVLYLLRKKVVSLPRDQREQVQRDTSNAPEDHLHYASVDWLGRLRHPQPQRDETATYATVALQQDRRH